MVGGAAVNVVVAAVVMGGFFTWVVSVGVSISITILVGSAVLEVGMTPVSCGDCCCCCCCCCNNDNSSIRATRWARNSCGVICDVGGCAATSASGSVWLEEGSVPSAAAAAAPLPPTPRNAQLAKSGRKFDMRIDGLLDTTRIYGFLCYYVTYVLLVLPVVLF